MAPFFALKHAPAAMGKLTDRGSYPNAAPKTQKYGSIIVISSVAAVHGGCWGPCYTMTSHAALGVVRAGVATLKGTGVRINCISPGQIDIGVDLQGVSSLTSLFSFPFPAWEWICWAVAVIFEGKTSSTGADEGPFGYLST